MNEIIVKKASSNIFKELESVKFDVSYINKAVNKYKGGTYKIFNLKAYEANILKQLCLSLGFDCAVGRDTVTCKCEYTDAVIFASSAQINLLINKLEKQPFRLKELALELKKAFFSLPECLNISNFVFDWSRPYIMGILNVTPDSFSDGGKYNLPESALSRALCMEEEGADIIDIGGESTRPDAETVTLEEEIKRVIPVIELIRRHSPNIIISVDTRNYITAKAAVEAGANIINDVSGLDYDEKLFKYVTENNIPVVVMHSDKVPAVSSDFSDKDVVEEVYFSLKKKIDKLIAAGLEKKNIIADVGIGFGKSKDNNFELLKRYEEFTTLGTAILLGISRKSFIRKEFNLTCEEADIPTALYSAALSGVNIHRVHNVKLVKRYLDYVSLIRG